MGNIGEETDAGEIVRPDEITSPQVAPLAEPSPEVAPVPVPEPVPA